MKLDFLSPLAISLAEIGATRDREYPLWFPWSWSEFDTICVEPPAGWIPDALPGALKYSGGFGSCDLSYALAGNQVIVTRRFHLDRGLIAPSDFDQFVEFWREVRDRVTKEIVFKKA